MNQPTPESRRCAEALPTRTEQPRRALVLLKSGHSYEARVEIEAGRLVHGRDVRLRVGDGSGRRLGARTWSVDEFREIRWRDDDQELAACASF